MSQRKVFMSDPIAILGRGTSLERYPEFAHLFHKVYLVNPFSAEIDKLGREHFKGKELVHVVCKGAECSLKKEQYELFPKTTTTANVTAAHLSLVPRSNSDLPYPNFQPMPACMLERGFPLVEWSSIAMILDTMVDLEPHLTHDGVIHQLESHLSDSIAANNAKAIASTRMWPTTGIFAIDLAIMTEKALSHTFYLFGFDCFQNGTDSYFIGNKKSHQTKFAQRVMKYYLRHLVQDTYATFRSADAQPNITEENWELIT